MFNTLKYSIESNRNKYDVFEDRELENVLQMLREEAENTDNNTVDVDSLFDSQYWVLGVPE